MTKPPTSGKANPALQPLVDSVADSIKATDAVLAEVTKMQEGFLKSTTTVIDKLVTEINVPPSDLAEQVKTLNTDVVKMTSTTLSNLPTDLFQGGNKKDDG